MRQLCNVSYTTQAGSFTDEDEFDAWDAELPCAPGERPKRKPPKLPRSGQRSAADLMRGGGLGNV